MTPGSPDSLGDSRGLHRTLGLGEVTAGGVGIIMGAPHVCDVTLLTGPGFGGVLSGAALVLFAVIGFDEVITLAEETHDPTRMVPRALLLALGISTALKIAVAVAAVSGLSGGAGWAHLRAR